jgi:hypothetical protein
MSAGFATPDGQFIVDLPSGAIAPVAGASSVAVHVTPLAPSRLRAVPGGLRANGNAYRVEMTHEPSGGAVLRFAKPGTLLLEIPRLWTALYTSPDAHTWASVSAQPLPSHELSTTAPFAAPGYYLAATIPPDLAPPAGSSHRSAVVIGILTTTAALLCFVLAHAVVRRRHATT